MPEPLQMFVFRVLPILLWSAFWLFAVDWKKTWPVLAQGAWVGVVLLILLAAIVCSHIDPTPWTLFGVGPLSSGWAYLVYASGWTLLALFCGWLQSVLSIAPTEIDLEPIEDHAAHAVDHH